MQEPPGSLQLVSINVYFSAGWCKLALIVSRFSQSPVVYTCSTLTCQQVSVF